jgi:predicted DNA-binding protein (UPF0251 family)
MAESFLTAKQQLAYRLHHHSPGLSQREIALRMGTTRESVCRLIARARARLAALQQLNGGEELAAAMIEVSYSAIPPARAVPARRPLPVRHVR